MNVNRYRGADGFTTFAGATDDLGQLVSSPSIQVLGPPQKTCIENIGFTKQGGTGTGLVLRRTQVGTSDGIAFIKTAPDPNGTISKPWGLDVDLSSVLTGAPTATNLGGPYGGWGSTGSKGVTIVAKNAVGRTIGSVEKVFTVGSVNEEWRYNWVQTPGATGYEVYVTDTPGTYGPYTLAATIGSGAITFFVDDGTVRTVGSPPEDNTTGGVGPYFGTDPVDGAFGTGDLTLATAPAGLAVGQQAFLYFRDVLPAGATAKGNQRVLNLFPVEV